MIQFIIGEKGKGKTKVLLEKANQEVKSANGNFVYLDNFMKIARVAEDEDVIPVLRQIEAIGRQFSVNFIISISLTRAELPEDFQEMITAEL